MSKSKIPDHEIARRRIGLQIAEYVAALITAVCVGVSLFGACLWWVVSTAFSLTRMLKETRPVKSRPSILDPLRKAIGIEPDKGSIEQLIAEATKRISLYDGMFDAVEELFGGCSLDMRSHPDESLDPLWQVYKAMIDASENGEAPVNKQVAELQAELTKWPRVYWKSAAPESLESGYRVLSVSGKACHEWMEILVDYHGEEMWAPIDFGLYSSSDDAKKAVMVEKE